MKEEGIEKGTSYVIWFTVFLFFSFITYILCTNEGGFDSDEFLHAAPPLDLSVFALNGEWQKFLSRIRGEVFYPPLHALITTPAFLVFGVSPFIARSVSLALFFFSLFFISLALKRFSKNYGDGEKSYHLAIIFILACPAAFLISTLVMLEPLGLTLVALLLYVLSKNECSWLVVSLLISLLLLTKHTFGLLLLPGIVLAARKEEAFFICKALAGAFLVYGIWLLSVDTRLVYRFLFGHHARGYVFGLEPNLYYFYSLIYDFHLFTPLAVISIPLALFGGYRYRSSFPVRVSFLSILISFILFGFIGERGPRHIVMIAPYWWFLIGVGSIALSNQLKESALQKLWKIFPILLLLVVVTGSMYHRGWFSTTIRQYMEMKPDQDVLIAEILPHIPTNERYTIYGASNLAFPYHIDWLVAARDGVSVSRSRKLRRVIPEYRRTSIAEAREFAKESELQLIVVRNKKVLRDE